MDKINIGEILRGLTPGSIQTVGRMQLIPLVGDEQDDRFVSPKGNGKVGNSGEYGTLNFTNTSDKTMIVPNNAAYVDKKFGQDHGMTHAGIVGKKSRYSTNTAACIQETMGGTIPDGDHPLMILPFPLRETAMDKRSESGYSKLWSSISTFNHAMGVTKGGGHIEFFFDKFKTELDQFVAEFEIIPKQLGAIILVDGVVVGVERAPNYQYWKDVWQPLIRECYGSLTLYVDKQQKGKLAVPSTRVPLDVSKIDSLDELAGALSSTEDKQRDKVKEIVRNLLDTDFAVTVEQSDDGFERDNIKNAQFIGQIVREELKIIYASLITTKKWEKNKEWLKSPAFTM